MEKESVEMPWRDEKKERDVVWKFLSVKKEANLSGRGKDEEEVGNGDVDLRWSSLLKVCQRRRGLAEDEETRLE